MVWFLGGTAVLCLLYYIIIVIYSGVSTSFALIWPCLAIFLGLLAAGWWFGSQHEGRIPVWIGVSVGTVCAAGFLILVITEVLIGWSAITATGQPADYVIVLGARVRGTRISNSLKQRLDRAIEYSEEYPNTVLVLSGGKGPGEEISEAACMYDYLTAHGVEPGRLILEDQASNTAENFALSKPLLYEAGVDPAEGRVAVVTNDFHIARSELIAAREGYGDVAGIPAPLPWVHLEINYTLREAFAMVKTFLFD